MDFPFDKLSLLTCRDCNRRLATINVGIFSSYIYGNSFRTNEVVPNEHFGMQTVNNVNFSANACENLGPVFVNPWEVAGSNKVL